jgi:hypothetical protein
MSLRTGIRDLLVNMSAGNTVIGKNSDRIDDQFQLWTMPSLCSRFMDISFSIRPFKLYNRFSAIDLDIHDLRCKIGRHT